VADQTSRRTPGADRPGATRPALRDRIADALRAWHARAVVCSHTQIIEYGAAADAVLEVVADALDALTAERDRLAEQVRGIAARSPWPPLAGDVWRDRHGHLHFGADYSPDYDDMDDRRGIGADGTRVVLLSQNADESCHPGADWHRPENVLQQLGPLTLVYRDEQQDAMTGPEHYKAGERYLTHAKNEIQISSSRAAALAQIAAAHFAAAQAAVLGDVGDDMDGPAGGEQP